MYAALICIVRMSKCPKAKVFVNFGSQIASFRFNNFAPSQQPSNKPITNNPIPAPSCPSNPFFRARAN